jgi:hypothetical protein
MSEERSMYNNKIALTAHRSESEPHRIHRLQRVVGYVCALGEDQRNYGVLSKVKELHDHKGDLLVTWKVPPSEEEKGYFLKAWESTIGDGGGPIEHILASP